MESLELMKIKRKYTLPKPTFKIGDVVRLKEDYKAIYEWYLVNYACEIDPSDDEYYEEDLQSYLNPINKMKGKELTVMKISTSETDEYEKYLYCIFTLKLPRDSMFYPDILFEKVLK